MDDYEGRENANGRMIDHLNKTINLNKGRIRTAKKRYIELNTEVTSRMKKKGSIKNNEEQSTKKQRVVEKGGEEETRYDILDSSSGEDDEHEDDKFEIEKQCNVKLHFDCIGSRTSGSANQHQALLDFW